MTGKPSLGRAVPVPAGRLSRLTRLGTMTAGVAGNMALNGVAQVGRGKRPAMRDLLLTPGNIGRITDQLAQMRGAAMKVGQLISMDSGEMLPPDLAEILARLRADAHFMPPAQQKQVLTAAWGEGWLKRFKAFDVHPIAAASIGQVHRAQTRDGRDLAIKIQYPGIAHSIDSDVANVGALIRMSGLLPAGLELAPYLDAACTQLHEETDYLAEARHLTRFGDLLGDDGRFVLPQVQADLTTPTVLAMNHVTSTPIEAATSLPQADRDRLAHDLIDLLLAELFSFGLMQTDPNFANYRLDPDSGRIVLLDFGATRTIDPAIAGRYRRLMAAGLAGDQTQMMAMAQEIGFVAADTAADHRRRIAGMMTLVFDLLRDDDKVDFTRTDVSARLQSEGIALAEAGFVPPQMPIDVLYLQRKFGGIFLLATRLRARVPVRDLLAPHLPH